MSDHDRADPSTCAAVAVGTPIGPSELMKAAARNDVAVLRRYIKQDGVLDVVVDGTTPLICAIDHGSTAFALAALDAGASHEGPLGRRRFALHAAVEHGSAAVVTKLLARPSVVRTRINTPDDKSRTPLFSAAVNARASIARMLLDAGANKDTFYNDMTPAQQAALGDGSEEAFATMRVFIERESDPVAFLSTYTGRGGACDSIVHLVASAGCAEMLGFLLDHGVPVDTEYGSGTLFWRACTAGNTDCLKELAKRGAALAWPGFSAMTLTLTMCPQSRRAATLGTLLELGLDPDAPDGKGRVPREMAQADPELVQLLAAHAARGAIAAVLGTARKCARGATVFFG